MPLEETLGATRRKRKLSVPDHQNHLHNGSLLPHSTYVPQWSPSYSSLPLCSFGHGLRLHSVRLHFPSEGFPDRLLLAEVTSISLKKSRFIPHKCCLSYAPDRNLRNNETSQTIGCRPHPCFVRQSHCRIRYRVF